MRIKDPEKIVRIATISTLSFMIVWGLVTVIAQVKPFWVDEWRVIYNLKFKTASTIWGPLDFMQQFPRVYIELIKAFASPFDYSYFTLRFPPYLAGTLTILLCYRLMNKIYGTDHVNRFLFVMILISCSTFTGYFVQIKQYTMDMFLCLVAIWQLLALLDITNTTRAKDRRYVLLCTSFLIAPFFSYTYPIAIAPAYVVLLVHSVNILKNSGSSTEAKRTLLFKWFPLLICTVSTSVFYVVDVAQLMHDEGMHKWWGHLMMAKGFSWTSLMNNIWELFAQIGAGLVFWFLFGVLGIMAFIFGIWSSIGAMRKQEYGIAELIRLYSILLLILTIILSAAGKFPLGEPRLNAFTIPAISIVIIYFLDTIRQKKITISVSGVLSFVLYAGVIGNIYTTFYASITGPVYSRQMEIYRSTENAIIMAQAKKLPIFITPEVAFPYDTTQNVPYYTSVPGDWVLKTFPAYKVADSVPVFAINNMNNIQGTVAQLPVEIKAAVAGDGLLFKIVTR